MTKRTGQCMCGAVTYSAEVAEKFSACFCKMCQRWSSGVFAGVMAENFEITKGSEHVTVFKSSDWAERAFCARCGSNLYYNMPARGVPSVAVGTLDDTSGLSQRITFFADKHPEGLRLAGGAKEMSEAECIAVFGGGS